MKVVEWALLWTNTKIFSASVITSFLFDNVSEKRGIPTHTNPSYEEIDSSMMSQHVRCSEMCPLRIHIRIQMH